MGKQGLDCLNCAKVNDLHKEGRYTARYVCDVCEAEHEMDKKGYVRAAKHVKHFLEKKEKEVKHIKVRRKGHGSFTRSLYFGKEKDVKETKEFVNNNYTEVTDSKWKTYFSEQDDLEKINIGGDRLIIKSDVYNELVHEKVVLLERYSQAESHSKVFETKEYLLVKINGGVSVFSKDEHIDKETRKRKFKVKDPVKIGNSRYGELDNDEKVLYSSQGRRVGELIPEQKAEEFISENSSELFASIL